MSMSLPRSACETDRAKSRGYPMTLSPSQTSKLESLVRMLSTSNKNEALASIVCIEELQILCGGSVIWIRLIHPMH